MCIRDRPSPSRQPQQRTGKPSLLIDIQNNIKAQQSAGYKHWATIEDLKRAAETLNFLTEHGISSYEEPVSYTHLDVYKRQPYRLPARRRSTSQTTIRRSSRSTE